MYNDTGILDPSKITERGYDSISDFINTYVNETYVEDAESIEPSSTILNPDSPIRLGYLAGDLHQLAQFVAMNATMVDGSKSIFEKYGLNVKKAPGAPFAVGGAVMTAFLAGTVDIGYLGAPPAILNHLNAAVDTSIIAQANSEGSGIVVGADAEVDGLRDMVNMTVAIPGTSSIQFLLLKTALEERGLELEIKT
jgi:NitT/TauT family transport system substrate-binding protein